MLRKVNIQRVKVNTNGRITCKAGVITRWVSTVKHPKKTVKKTAKKA